MQVALVPSPRPPTRPQRAARRESDTAQHVHQIITDRIIQTLEAGEHGDWQCPWHKTGGSLPKNALTGRAYRGINTLALWCEGHARGYADIADVEGTFGGIDVLHFNAAAMRNQTLADQPRDTFYTDLSVNVGGAIAATQAAAPKMLARGSGSVLLTGGGFALQPHPEYLSLSIGKAAIRALAQGIFDTFKEKGVHVATVTVAGFVSSEKDATVVAEHFWQLHSQPSGAWEVEVMYTPEA